MRSAQLHDGRMLQFPDETTDEVMDSVVQKELANPPQAAITEPSDWDILSAAVDKAKILPTRIGETLSAQFTSTYDEETGETGFKYASDEETKQNLEGTRTEQRAELMKAHPNVIGTKHEDSALFMAGEIGTEIFADPVTYVPFIGTGVKGAALGSAGLAGVDNVFRQKVETGEVDPIQAAGATALGLGLGYGVGKVGQHFARKTMKAVEDEATRLVASGAAPKVAARRALLQKGLGDKKVLEGVEKRAGRGVETPQTRSEAQTTLTNTKDSRKLTGRIGKAAQAVTKYAQAEVFNPTSKIIKRAFQPIYDRIEVISPEVANLLRKFEFNAGKITNERVVSLQPFAKAYHKMSDVGRRELKLVLLNGNRVTTAQFNERISAVLDKVGNPNLRDELQTGITAARKLMDDMFDTDIKMSGNTTKAGNSIKKHSNFIPREVRFSKADLKEIEDLGAFQKEFGRVEKKEGRTLSDQERTRIIAKQITNPTYVAGAGVRIPDHLKRRFATVDRSNVDDYLDVPEVLNSYIREITHNSQKRQLFGLGSEDTLEDSVGKFLQNKGFSGQDQGELKHLLQVRFGAGEQSAAKLNQDIKNLFYASTLGNIKNAITQLGDTVMSTYVNGLIPTIRAIAGIATGTRKGALVDIDLGITRAGQELETMAGTTKALNTLFKYTGFSSVDRFGKQVIADAAYMKAKKLASNPKTADKFKEKYRKMFLDDAEWDKFTKALKDGKHTDETKLYQFSTISELQPISKSEMPEFYLQNPNLRMMYMLKTFTIKQLNLANKTAVRKLRSGNPKETAEGAYNLTVWAALLTMSGAAPQAIKQAMWNGMEVDDWDDLMQDNFLKIFGLSKYNVRDFSDSPMKTVVQQWMMPPVSVADDFVFGDGAKKIKSLPYGDDLMGIYSWFK